MSEPSHGDDSEREPDPDADPGNLNPRDTLSSDGDGPKGDPDGDPDNLNPRSTLE